MIFVIVSQFDNLVHIKGELEYLCGRPHFIITQYMELFWTDRATNTKGYNKTGTNTVPAGYLSYSTDKARNRKDYNKEH